MTRPKERYCKRGHDTWEVGRLKGNGWCRLCSHNYNQRAERVKKMREAQVAHRKRRQAWERKRRIVELDGPPLPDLPAEPLARLIEQSCVKYADGDTSDKGRMRVAQIFADRFGGTSQTHSRSIYRIFRNRLRTVKYETADEWCIALGSHVSLIYSEAELSRSPWRTDDSESAGVA